MRAEVVATDIQDTQHHSAKFPLWITGAQTIHPELWHEPMHCFAQKPMYTYSFDPRQAVSVSDVVTPHHFGANYVYNYERFGDLPWEKYDEAIEKIGLTNIRYPGGNGIETNFDFTNPNSTTNLWGQDVTPLDEFIKFIGERDLDATLIMPTRPFLPGESHEFVVFDSSKNDWAVDAAKFETARADIEAFIRTIMEEAHEHGARIYAIELGNEYPGVDWTTPSGEPSKMNAKQYGAIANQLAKTVQDTIDAFNAELGIGGQDPKIVAQIWGDYNQDGIGTSTLKTANMNVLSQFDAEGLAAIDAVADHIYFKNLKSNSAGEMHSYEGLSAMIEDMLSMSKHWDVASGKNLDILISEWNIQKFSFYDPGFDYWDDHDSWEVSQDWLDHSTFGLKQVAPMLEMFSAFLAGGVDSTHIWSVMYSSSALGTHMNGAQLFAAGGLVQLMASNLIGTRYVELGLQTDAHDIHYFEGDTAGHVFVSSLKKEAQTIQLDLSEADGSLDNIKVKYLRADQENADGQFTINGTTYVFPDLTHAYLEADLSLLVETGLVEFQDGVLTLELGSFETAYVSFDRENHTPAEVAQSPAKIGHDFLTDGVAFSAALHGAAVHNTVDGHIDAGILVGGNSDDTLEGTVESDAIYGKQGDDFLMGGDGDDRLFGGSGYDDLEGDAVGLNLWGQMETAPMEPGNNDVLMGGRGNDFLVGGQGEDRLDGGAGNDVLKGGLNGDIFVFEGKFGHDIVTDFDSAEDQIAITSPESITNLTKEQLIVEFARELGSDVLIELTDDASITLRNTTLDELEEADVFVA